MGDVPEQVYSDAARAWVTTVDDLDGQRWADLPLVIPDNPALRAAVASAYRAGQAATPDGPRELVSLLSKRIADLRAELGEEFCTCESYDCHGECCGIGNCTCTTDATPDRRLLASLRESDLALTWLTDATPDGPRRWALPDEPGPEVTAVRDRLGRIWSRVRGLPLWGGPETVSVLPFVDLLDQYGPLTDVTPAADGQDGDGPRRSARSVTRGSFTPTGPGPGFEADPNAGLRRDR